jgi:hypothetical protein
MLELDNTSQANDLEATSESGHPTENQSSLNENLVWFFTTSLYFFLKAFE